MAYNNDKLARGLSLQYEEKQKEKKSSYKNINNNVVNDTEFNGSESYKKMQEGLSAKQKKNNVQEISFYTEHTLNRKYIDETFNSSNAHDTILLINSMSKRKQECQGYLLSGLKAKRDQAMKELQDINYVFDKYADKIEYLVENGVLQRSNSSDALFRIE